MDICPITRLWNQNEPISDTWKSRTGDMSNVKLLRSNFPASFHREAAECRTSSLHTVPRTTDAAPVSFVVGELPPGWKCDALDCYRRRASGVTLPHQEEYWYEQYFALMRFLKRCITVPDEQILGHGIYWYLAFEFFKCDIFLKCGSV